MNKRSAGVCVLLALLACLSLPARAQDKADFVLTHGRVFTSDPDRPWAEAVAVRGDRIAAVGTTRGIGKWTGPATQVLDVQGKLVLPGLNDAHLHFVSGGNSLARLSFRGVDSIAKVQEIVARRIKEIPPGAPVLGSEYDHTLFPGGNWPTRQDLDKVSPSNPVIIDRVDGHSVWVNSLALKQSGITKKTQNPFGGEILKDPKTGEPTGILTEAAVSLLKIKDTLPRSTTEQNILRGLAHASSLGLTSVTTSSSLAEMKVWEKLKKEGKLTLRVYAWLPIEGLDRFMHQGIKQGQGDAMLKVGFQKAYIDGTLGSGTALMFAAFADEPSKTGLPQHPYHEFADLIEKAHANGYQVGVHAIGDKGVNWVLNAVEAAQAKHGKKELRHRIEHGQIIIPEDWPRFARLGVVASMQPTHCTTDMRFCERRVGLERSKNAYLWRTLLNHKAHLAFGSDWPVEPLDPMRGLYSAVARKSIELDSPEGGWFPEQKLTMAEAVRLFTQGAAYGAFEEGIKGQLKPGMLADMVVLSKDIFTVEPREILKTQVITTILGGKIVYQKKL